jgi:hypothetical protein
MRRTAKPLIALIAAYGIVLSSLLASIVSGQAAASPAGLCLSSVSADAPDTSPASPLHHDLSCLTGCVVAVVGSLPIAAVVSDQFIMLPVQRNTNSPAHLKPSIFGVLSARAPPARI